jgi:DNA-binding CsgD family transcriptional regulator
MSGIGKRVQQLREHIENGNHPDSFVPEDELPGDDPQNRPDTVTAAQCNAIRCAAQDGKQASEIAALFDCVDSRHTVHNHATGVCSHEDNIEPVMATTQITDDDCRRMRARYKNTDMSQRDIADAVRGHRSTVAYHLSGRCAHEHATENCAHDNGTETDMAVQKITAADCRRMQSWYEHGDMRQRDIADALEKHQSTVSYHLTGRCSHNHD